MERRLAQIHLVMIVCLSLLVARLAHLQIIQGSRYRQLAERNRLRVIPEPAPRGLIVDRRGRILATNRTVFRVAVVPQELHDLSAVLAHVSALTGRPEDVLRRAYQQERSVPFVPVTVISRIANEGAIRLEETRWQVPGLLVSAEAVRHYPLGRRAAHLLGYLSQPTPEEFPVLKHYGVRPRQLVGRAGLEQLLDHALRGVPGGQVIEVDHRARQVRVVGRRPPGAGARVTLTIDAELQSRIEEAFGTQPGACVVLDPLTGEVLAMASLPSFVPEVFADGDTAAIRTLLSDAQSSLMNRATVGVYPPGSIAKPLTAAAALEYHLVTPQTPIVCRGALTIGDRAFHCWNRDGHGPLTLPGAITQSCNVYFMQLGRRLGATRLRDTMAHGGFSRRTGWLLGEQAGHLPQRRLTEGELALLATGQGEILVTPLQAAVMVSAFANGGWLVEPWVVREIAGESVERPRPRRRVEWSAETIRVIREGMAAVVASPAGTGHGAMSPLISIAGKTGTAQTHLAGRTHGWFIGFCPTERPRAAFAVLAEYGGSGGDLPASIGRLICEFMVRPGAES